MLRILSLGAGVQSTTLALMATKGEIEAPDCAIFADTGWEPQAVYFHLALLEKELSFPLYRVSGGNLRSDYLGQAQGKRSASIPYFTTNGMKPRHCTTDYKVKPIIKKVREIAGLTGKRAPRKPIVEQYIGISLDEVQRMKPSRLPWIRHRWPLIELEMSRFDCENWLKKAGWTHVPKSACIGCPFHSDHHWRNMRDHDPASWSDALEFDLAMRHAAKGRGLNEESYMHKSCKPLAEVDLSTWSERGQPDLFNMECEGMCGV